MRLDIMLLGLTLVLVPSNGTAFQLDLNKLQDLVKKGAEAFSDVSEEREVEIGQGMAAQLLGAAPLVEDELIQRYVNNVGLWLAMQTERPDLPWRFGVIDTDSYNAFAAPGGYVFITRGLFEILRTESELAGVLAHEIGHVLARHHLEAIKAQARNSLAAGVMTELAAQKSSLASSNKQLLNTLVSSGIQLYAKGLDRGDEFEADRLGVVIAARAGYEPFGLPGVLLALDALDANESSLSLMISTHPSFRDRLVRLDAEMGERLTPFSERAHAAERFLSVQERIE